MTFPVTFRHAARSELIEAASRYEAERAGLGVEFISEIERCVTLAAEHPQIYSDVHNGVRRVIARRFPYSAYFRVETRRIVILAIFHSSRDPTIWQERT